MKLVSLFKKPMFLVGLFSALFFSSLIISLAVYMGHESGNFVIQIEGGDLEKALMISETLDEQGKNRLEAPGYSGLSHSTYSFFSEKIDDYVRIEGGSVDEKTHVYHYSFYILNKGQTSVDVQASLSYSSIRNNVDQAIRVLTIASTTDEIKLYQATDTEDCDYGVDYPRTTSFIDNGTVFEESYLALEPEDYIRYSILIWLEGKDPDCTDEILNGAIKFTMKLSIL